MKRFKCLLLDANVVIKIFSLGLWNALVKQYELHLSEIVVGESDYYEDSSGARQNIDLEPFIATGEVQVFSHSSSELERFRSSFDLSYLERLDPGETESLVHLLSEGNKDLRLCSADGIVFRVLGNLGLSDKGVSLEEVLDQFKMQRKLEHHFSRDARQRWAQEGLADGLYGRGLKK
jgi:hypothetical protein